MRAEPAEPMTGTRTSARRIQIERMPLHYGFFAVRPGRDQVDRHPGERLHSSQVVARGLGQSGVRLHADGAFLPARQFLVLWHAACQFLRTDRQDIGEPAFHVIAYAKLHRLHAIEHIEFRDAQRSA